MSKSDELLLEEAKKNVLKTRQVVKEFPNYPKNWLNKLICFRYNINEPISRQIRKYVEFEKKNKV